MVCFPPELVVKVLRNLPTNKIIALGRTLVSFGMATLNIELWKQKFHIAPGIQMLDEICMLWEEQKLEIQEELKKLVLSHVLRAFNLESSLDDACNIYIKTEEDGENLVLNTKALEDIKRFERLFGMTGEFNILKIQEPTNVPILLPFEIISMAERVKDQLKSAKFQTICLSTPASVLGMLSILQKTDQWSIQEIHIKGQRPKNPKAFHF